MPHDHRHTDGQVHDHDHDLGFAHDLPRMIGRRKVLTLLVGAGVAAVSGAPAFALEHCVGLPWETAGPYPADGSNVKDGQTVNALTQEGVIREDLRTSFGGMTPTAEGLELTLELDLVNADGCTPLVGAAIYLWHCDTTGLYSLYDTTDRNYLRGVGVSDADGKVRFTTIYPGCYDGRWPHIHFEIFDSVDAAVAGEASVLTAQIAMPEAESAQVYQGNALYSNGTANLNRITIASDNVFSDNSADEITQQTMVITGDVNTALHGTVTIPVDYTAERSTSMAPPLGGFGGPDGQRPPVPPKG
jgi:protocatechuate 3,4-dioxygenase beta subunit